MTEKQLERRLRLIRRALEVCFADDTAYSTPRETPSSGHCAIVAMLVQDECGGDLVSTYVKGVSHWLNRLTLDGGPGCILVRDVDLTGDQFGYEPIAIGCPGELFQVRKRNRNEIDARTGHRFQLLRDRVVAFLKYGERP